MKNKLLCLLIVATYTFPSQGVTLFSLILIISLLYFDIYFLFFLLLHNSNIFHKEYDKIAARKVIKDLWTQARYNGKQSGYQMFVSKKMEEYKGSPSPSSSISPLFFPPPFPSIPCSAHSIIAYSVFRPFGAPKKLTEMQTSE